MSPAENTLDRDNKKKLIKVAFEKFFENTVL